MSYFSELHAERSADRYANDCQGESGIYRSAYRYTWSKLIAERDPLFHCFHKETIKDFDRLIAGEPMNGQHLSPESREHMRGSRAAMIAYAKQFPRIEVKASTPNADQVERLLAAIDHIVAQGHSSSAEQAIDDAYYLARDIREELGR